MPEAINGDVRLHYLDEGQGEALLLVHGHTLDLRIWDRVVPSLVGAGLRVLRADLRGHGRSGRPDRGYHWMHHASDMAAVLDAAGVGSCALVGFSLGGGVALEMAVTMADRVASLVLLSAVLPDRPFEKAFFDNLREVARAIRADGVAAAMRGPWLASPLWSSSGLGREVRRELERIVADFPGADYLATERDRVERDWQLPGRLGEIAVPTLVIAGAEELPGFVAWSEEIAGAIPGARLELLEGHGHLHLLEAPDRIAAVITKHVAG